MQSGNTALFHSLVNKYSELSQYLIDSGADVTVEAHGDDQALPQTCSLLHVAIASNLEDLSESIAVRHEASLTKEDSVCATHDSVFAYFLVYRMVKTRCNSLPVVHRLPQLSSSYCCNSIAQLTAVLKLSSL